MEEIKDFDKGISITRIEELMKTNKNVYGGMFTPIIWLDGRTMPRLEKYLEEHHNLDKFIT